MPFRWLVQLAGFSPLASCTHCCTLFTLLAAGRNPYLSGFQQCGVEYAELSGLWELLGLHLHAVPAEEVSVYIKHLDKYTNTWQTHLYIRSHFGLGQEKCRRIKRRIKRPVQSTYQCIHCNTCYVRIYQWPITRYICYSTVVEAA